MIQSKEFCRAGHSGCGSEETANVGKRFNRRGGERLGSLYFSSSVKLPRVCTDRCISMTCISLLRNYQEVQFIGRSSCPTSTKRFLHTREVSKKYRKHKSNLTVHN